MEKAAENDVKNDDDERVLDINLDELSDDDLLRLAGFNVDGDADDDDDDDEGDDVTR